MPLGSLLCNRLILGSELVSLHDPTTVTSKAIPTCSRYCSFVCSLSGKTVAELACSTFLRGTGRFGIILSSATSQRPVLSP